MVWIRVPLKQLQSDLGLPETAATRSRSTKKSNIKVSPQVLCPAAPIR